MTVRLPRLTGSIAIQEKTTRRRSEGLEEGREEISVAGGRGLARRARPWPWGTVQASLGEARAGLLPLALGAPEVPAVHAVDFPAFARLASTAAACGGGGLAARRRHQERGAVRRHDAFAIAV